jgi:beta-galactosidase
MRYGTSYYPEHKAKEELEKDIELLKNSGINTVRMGEFAWSKMEPNEGEYQFQWLALVVNELGESGIDTILCTPTACPPIWLIEKHPDILYQDNKRVVRPFGGRRHYCYSNETYHQYSEKITKELSLAFQDNKYIVGIQIDNEPAQEGTGRCTCKSCTNRFHSWLEVKYDTIEEFNRRSGSVFWSQEYSNFKQVPIPVNSIEVGTNNLIQAYYENPTVRLLFEEFSSDMQIEYQDLQVTILKEFFPQIPITTNATGLATNSIDYYKSFQSLDRYAFDYYPDLRDAKVSSFPYAFARGIKEDVPFWVLEFMSGGGHRLGGSGRLQPNPGALKQAVLQSFAHKAEMMLHFQFRTFPFGAEQLNYAIVDMDGVPRRRYFEMKETANLLKKLEKLEAAEFKNEIAICFDYASHWALRIKPVNDPDFHYINYCEKLYHSFETIGYNANVISLQEDFTKYKIVVLPATIIVSRQNQERLKKYVAEGGILIATFLTSVKNEDNVGYTDILPAGLQDVFESSVEEVEPVFAKNRNTVKLDTKGKSLKTSDRSWSELLGGQSKCIGTYLEDYKNGKKVISEHKYKEGYAYYIGTDMEKNAYESLFQYITDLAGLKGHGIDREDNVEVVTRYLVDKEIIFIFNFTNHDTTIQFSDSYVDYITNETVENKVIINRNETLIVYRDTKY